MVQGCNSKIYSDIWQVVIEFEEFIGGIFEVLQLEVDKEAVKHKQDMQKVRQMEVIPAEKCIKDQCKLVWKTYQKYGSQMTPGEKSCVLHIIVYLIYFCQDSLFPLEKFLTHKEWTKFNMFIDNRTDVEIEKEMSHIFT